MSDERSRFCERLTRRHYDDWEIDKQFTNCNCEYVEYESRIHIVAAAIFYSQISSDAIIVCSDYHKVKALFLMSDILKSPILIACKRMTKEELAGNE